MMRPLRALFFASLACILGPLALTERTPQADVVTAPVVIASPIRFEAHPSPDAARLVLPGIAVDRSTDPPFSGPFASFATGPAVAATVAAEAPALTAPAPLDRLPPSRAPPTLS